MPERNREIPNPTLPLARLVRSTLTVSDIVTRPLWCLKPSLSADDALDAMRANDFTVAGVEGDPVDSYVTRADLQNQSQRVRRASRPILASQCIERSLPIADLFEVFLKHEYVFVLDGSEVRWLINHSDLAATAISAAVLAHLAAIEEGLKELGKGYSEEEVLNALSEASLAEARVLHAKRTRKGISTSILDCFTFSDWLNWAKMTPDVLSRLGFNSTNQFKRFTGSLVDLRNDTAHGRGILADPSKQGSLQRVLRAIEFTRRVWQEVDRDQPIWDRFAETEIARRNSRSKPFAGLDAIANWAWTDPVHVLTAHNPAGIWSTSERNTAANRNLRKTLERLGVALEEVIGRSRERDWKEDSFLVHGLQRELAAEIGARFGQTAIFELTAEELRVIRCEDGEVLRIRPRVQLSDTEQTP